LPEIIVRHERTSKKNRHGAGSSCEKGEIKMPKYSMVLLAVLFAVIYFTVWVIEKIRYMVRKISDLESRIQQLEVRMDSAAEKEDHKNGKEV
jgi:outer membrane murein-binding lipoprotein Lpp